jgi:hypothetical protein
MESKLFSGIQTFFQEAGEAACYALCIAKIAEKINGRAVDPIEALLGGIERKLVHYSWDNPDDPDNFYVNDAEKFLSLLTGKQVIAIKTDNVKYRPGLNEYVAERWERPTAKTVYSHFRLSDWDSLRDPQTVKYGKLVSLRVFRPS